MKQWERNVIQDRRLILVKCNSKMQKDLKIKKKQAERIRRLVLKIEIDIF